MTQEKIKIGLLADTHLRLMHYGSAVRGEQILKTLKRVIMTACVNDVKYLCCAGDFLDSNNPGIDVVASYIPEVDTLLRRYGMTLFITKGNHDTVEPSWYSIVGEDREQKDGGIVPVKDGQTVTLPCGISIKGWDWGGKDRFRELATTPSTFEGANLVMMHGEIRELCGFPTDSSVSRSEFVFPEAGGARVVLVGHIHVHDVWEDTYQGVTRAIVSPGATDICSMQDASEKGVLTVVSFEEDGSYHLEDLSYAKTWNRIFTIQTSEVDIMEHIREAQEDIENRGGVVYLKHTPDMLDKVHSIRQSIMTLPYGKDIVVVQSMLATENAIKEFSEAVVDARAAKEEIATYFAENADKFLPPEYAKDEALVNLGIELLHPEINGKVALEQYVENEIGTIII